MKLKILLAISVIAVLTTQSAGYKILCVFPVASRSHDILGKGIVNALLKAGHQVSWATPFLDKKPVKNLTLIDVSDTLSLQQELSNIEQSQRFVNINEVKIFAKNIVFATTRNSNLRAALVENQYDAVVTEWFLSDVYAGIAAVQQTPWIIFSSTAMHPYLEYLVDEIRSLSILPMMITEYPLPMNFLQRLMTTLIAGMMYADTMLNLPEAIEIYEQYAPLADARGVSLPPLLEAIHNVSILLVNSHPSYASSQSLPPNVVEIGGFHLDEDVPKLPEDIQQILDSSHQGVIYFSMGSAMKSSTLPQHKKRELLKVLGELPYKVLWKFEEELQDLPKNVYVRPWLPQLSILAHSNVKLFITHGGLLSLQEAIYSGVPLLVIPIYGDQPANAIRAVAAGFARRLMYSDNLASDLRVVLKDMMQNDSYHKQARHLSKLFRSRPVAPSKLISHYVELAIESKGAYHLRSKAQLYAWYQRWMVDQLILLLVLTYILFKVVFIIIGFLVRKLKSKLYGAEKKRKSKRN